MSLTLPLVLAAAGASAPVVAGMPALTAPPPLQSTLERLDAASLLEAPPKLRNGLVLGLAFGGGVARGAGYPNNSQQIGDPKYHSDSGILYGGGETLLLLGALTDYLSFGFWFASSSFTSGDKKASDFGIGLRVEAFPLVVQFPRLQGWGAFAEFGIGGATLVMPGVPEAQGTQSFIGVGSFYEWSFGHFLGGHFAIGPSLEYDATFSRPFEENGLMATARVVFYGGN